MMTRIVVPLPEVRRAHCGRDDVSSQTCPTLETVLRRSGECGKPRPKGCQMRGPLGLVAILVVAIAVPAFAAKPHCELTGRVVAIADADTLTVIDANKVQHKSAWPG